MRTQLIIVLLAVVIIGVLLGYILKHTPTGSVLPKQQIATTTPTAVLSSSTIAQVSSSTDKTFTWRGITFQYPATWQAAVLKYGSAAMTEEGKYDEVGFYVYKLGGSGNVTFAHDYTIEAGGPQQAGATCAEYASRGENYTRCADITDPSADPSAYVKTIPLYTLSTRPETIAVFEQIVRTAKK